MKHEKKLNIPSLLRTRLDNVANALVEMNLDGLIVTKLENIRYLSLFSGSSALMAIRTRDKKMLFCSDGRYELMSKVELEKAGLSSNIFIGNPASQLNEVNRHFLRLKRIGIEANSVTLSQLKTLSQYLENKELVETDLLIEKIRQIKDELEIANIKEACHIADYAFSKIEKKINPKHSEKELAIMLDNYMLKYGAQSTSFETIVASGKNGALPHAKPSFKKLKEKEAVVFDFGALYEGYCSDMTRTLKVGARLNKKLTEIYKIVYDAQALGVQSVKAGQTCGSIDKVCRDYISKYGYEKEFNHSTGHGVGLEIHELPWVSAKSETVLENNMVITVEPGIYLEGIGGVRIEDTVVVGENGCEVLTGTRKEKIWQ